MAKNLVPELLIAGSLLISTTAAGQMAAPLETSALLANPRLSPEARRSIQDRVDAVHAKFRASHGGLGPEQFGVQCCQITQIPAAAFTPLGGGEPWRQEPSGYLYPQSDDRMWAPVLLPSGAEIQFLDLYYYNYLLSDTISALLFAYSGGGPGSGAATTTVLAAAVGAYGASYVFAGLTHTVNNNVAYDPLAAQLAVAVEADAFGSKSGFRGVDLWWMRQVSPAPPTATFSDVPTNHPFFQFVEALAGAGITAGYPDGRFGVDDAITRGQMAVFLAKALGLFWPY